MTTQPSNISVMIPVGKALTRVGTVLFQPFDIGKWFVIGFCAWLACLGEGGGFHGGGNFGGGHGHPGRGAREGFEHVRDYVMNNIGWIAPLAIGIIIVITVLWLVVLWVSSRGRFMFLHCVALNVGEVQVPWQRFAVEANSLFLFRVVLSVMGILTFLPLVGGLCLVVMRMVCREAATVSGVTAAAGLFLAAIVAGISFWIIGRFTKDFVVPIQFLRRSSCLGAWREFRSLLSGNVANLVLYLLFRIVLAIGIALAVVLLVLATCCVAGCFMAVPYIGTVLLLPILVFDRAYSLHYLAQYGPDYDIFPPPAAHPLGQVT